MTLERRSVTASEVRESFQTNESERNRGLRGVYYRIDYDIDNRHIDIGFAYLTRDHLSVMWSNENEDTFSRIDILARGELPKLIYGDSMEPERCTVQVDLTLRSDPTGMRSYRIEDGILPDGYENALRRPDQVTFARFDTYGDSEDSPLLYGFTAEKSYPASPPFELGIMLPRSTQWSTPLSSWVIMHHAERRTLASERDAVAQGLTDKIREIGRGKLL